VFTHTDLNCLSVPQYAVEVLNVKQIILCGHYGCGGINTAIKNMEFGIIDNSLRSIKDIHQKTRLRLDGLKNDHDKLNMMCELNVIEQVGNICHSSIVEKTLKNGQGLSVHCWIYTDHMGFLKDPNMRNI
jgi:carbonic anhydrase